MYPSARTVENPKRLQAFTATRPILQDLQTSIEAPSSPRLKPLHFIERKSSSRRKGQSHHQHRTAYPPSPPPSQHKHSQNHTYNQTTRSYASIKSHYQKDSTLNLPSATTWPSQSSVAENRRIENDLLGLSLDQVQEYPYPTTRIPDDDLVCAGQLIGDMNAEFFGCGGEYGMTMRGESATDTIFAWNQDRYGCGFVERKDDVLPRL